MSDLEWQVFLLVDVKGFFGRYGLAKARKGYDMSYRSELRRIVGDYYLLWSK